MSSTRKKLLRTSSLVVNVDCGCRRPMLAAVFHQRPKKSTPVFGTPNQLYQSSWSSWDNATRSTTSESSPPNSELGPAKKSASLTKKGIRIGKSVAVVKESNDPYLDFRQSMLQMIMEKEIFAEADLRELLNCFLALNSPYHHGVIIRAFTEIWSVACEVVVVSPEMAVRRISHGARRVARGRGM